MKKDYEILAKFFVPVEQCEAVLRDPLYSRIQYAGCYLLRDTREDRDSWALPDPTQPAGYHNQPCRYVIAYEDWCNTHVSLEDTEINEFDLDHICPCVTYSQALVEFQCTVSEILLEMNTYAVQSKTQEEMNRAFVQKCEQERRQAAQEEFEQRLAQDPPLTAR